jgi:hypothetical protein
MSMVVEWRRKEACFWAARVFFFLSRLIEEKARMAFSLADVSSSSSALAPQLMHSRFLSPLSPLLT